MRDQEARSHLEAAFAAAVAAADPAAAARQAVAGLAGGAARVRLFALGKAAPAMAAGARQGLEARGRRVTGGLVVAHANDAGTPHGLPAVLGDHPLPGGRSDAAATRLGAALAETGADEDAVVLVSGGATSLVAAPVDDVPAEALRRTFAVLLASGADIVTMNALRKRLLRWGAGRLALALAARRVECLVASDVLDADAGSVASGPCSPDPMTAAELQALLRARGLEALVPAEVRAHLAAVAAGAREETPKPSAARFATTSVRVVLDYRAALRGAEAELRSRGLAPVTVGATPMRGEAAVEAARFVDALVAWRDAIPRFAGRDSPGAALVRAGEMTVTLPASLIGGGGRCQEFALACARSLHERGRGGAGVYVLAAGTDGRDGPTDAAGAIVDARTWKRIAAAGGAPGDALAVHRSHDALDRAGALLRTGPTGTNVNDLVIALAAPPAEAT